MTNACNIIVGSGQSGACAAVAMRDCGFEGRIILIGDESHLPYERPPLSKSALLDDELPAQIYAEEEYSKREIEMVIGDAVVSVDADKACVTLGSGRRFSYDKLLLATGACPRQLDIPGADQILYLRTPDDARRLRAKLALGGRVLCIGAGVLGLEIACSARAANCQVAVVEAGEGVMERSLCPDGRAYVEELHRVAEVEFLFCRTVAAVAPHADGTKCVTLDDGRELVADCVVGAVGIKRRLELARRIGLEVEEGILVDEYGRTALDKVYGAGEVCAFWHPLFGERLRLEAWRHAMNHGISVGRAMAGVLEPYADVPWFWTDQYGKSIQVAGFPQRASRTIRVDADASDRFTLYHLTSDRVLIGVTGVNQPRKVRAAQKSIEARERLADTADLLAGDSPQKKRIQS